MIEYSLKMIDKKTIVEKLIINESHYLVAHTKQSDGSVSGNEEEIHELAEKYGSYDEEVLDKIYEITDGFLALDIFELDEMV